MSTEAITTSGAARETASTNWNAEPTHFKRILVAVDESAQSGFAVDAAEELASQLVDCEVALLHAFQVTAATSPSLGYVQPEIRLCRMEEGKALLQQAKAKMPDPNRVTRVLREGDAATEILATAALYDVDLIILGTHGRGPVGQVFIGSVASAVARKATCPVMTVMHPVHAAVPA